VRIYESGHEVPFYQPLVALQLLNRTIHGMDLATGKTKVTSAYLSKGPKSTTFHEGNATVQFDVIPTDATYNTTTNAPNNSTGGGGGGSGKKTKRRNRARNAKTVQARGWLLPDGY